LAEHRRHLRNYMIDKRLQLRYVGAVALLSAALCGVFGWLIWQQQVEASNAVLSSVAASDYLPPEVRAEVTSRLHSSDLEFVLVMAGVCLGLITVLSLFLVILTHKVAGPLYKIGLYLDEIHAGRLPLMRDLRRWDEFKRFFEKFRRMIEALRIRASTEAEAFLLFAAACEEQGLSGQGPLGHALEELTQLGKEKQRSLATNDPTLPPDEATI
jgi:hypothetical protein